MEAGPATRRRQAPWDLAVILRQMGRVREAVTLTHDYRMNIQERLLPEAAPYSTLLEAQCCSNRGTIGLPPPCLIRLPSDCRAGPTCRVGIATASGPWVHEADARAQLRDTGRLAILADTMEVRGQAAAVPSPRSQP